MEVGIMDIPYKHALLKALREHLGAEIATMRRLALDAAEAATHEDNRPESDKDMRSTEASYIARGQAARVLELERELSLLGVIDVQEREGGTIGVGSLVVLSSGGKEAEYFLVPSAGGVALQMGGNKVQTLSVQSPLGAALLGLSEGDEAELNGPRAVRSYEILKVR
jgi:transcription elongation GreA/GreB family factor